MTRIPLSKVAIIDFGVDGPPERPQYPILHYYVAMGSGNEITHDSLQSHKHYLTMEQAWAKANQMVAPGQTVNLWISAEYEDFKYDAGIKSWISRDGEDLKVSIDLTDKLPGWEKEASKTPKKGYEPSKHPYPHPLVFRRQEDYHQGIGRAVDEYREGRISGMRDFIEKKRKEPGPIRDLYQPKKRKKKKKAAYEATETSVSVRNLAGKTLHDTQSFPDPHLAFQWAKTQVAPDVRVVILPLFYEVGEDEQFINRHWSSTDGADFIEEMENDVAIAKEDVVARKPYGLVPLITYLGDFSALFKIASNPIPFSKTSTTDDTSVMFNGYCAEAKDYWDEMEAETPEGDKAVEDFLAYISQVKCEPKPLKPKKADDGGGGDGGDSGGDYGSGSDIDGDGIADYPGSYYGGGYGYGYGGFRNIRDYLHNYYGVQPKSKKKRRKVRRRKKRAGLVPLAKRGGFGLSLPEDFTADKAEFVIQSFDLDYNKSQPLEDPESGSDYIRIEAASPQDAFATAQKVMGPGKEVRISAKFRSDGVRPQTAVELIKATKNYPVRFREITAYQAHDLIPPGQTGETREAVDDADFIVLGRTDQAAFEWISIDGEDLSQISNTIRREARVYAVHSGNLSWIRIDPDTKLSDLTPNLVVRSHLAVPPGFQQHQQDVLVLVYDNSTSIPRPTNSQQFTSIKDAFAWAKLQIGYNKEVKITAEFYPEDLDLMTPSALEEAIKHKRFRQATPEEVAALNPTASVSRAVGKASLVVIEERKTVSVVWVSNNSVKFKKTEENTRESTVVHWVWNGRVYNAGLPKQAIKEHQ